MSKKQPTHGGRRNGAGRPKINGETVSRTFRLPLDVSRFLDESGTPTATLVSAVRAMIDFREWNVRENMPVINRVD